MMGGYSCWSHIRGGLPLHLRCENINVGLTEGCVFTLEGCVFMLVSHERWSPILGVRTMWVLGAVLLRGIYSCWSHIRV